MKNLLIIAACGLVFVGLAVVLLIPNPSAAGPGKPLSCKWSAVDIVGGTHGQPGAVRCYLKALAERNTTEMDSVVPMKGYGGQQTVQESAFAFSKDAASGTATATITQNPQDHADAELEIRFSDGRTDFQELHIADPSSSDGWRFWAVNTHSDKSSIVQ